MFLSRFHILMMPSWTFPLCDDIRDDDLSEGGDRPADVVHLRLRCESPSTTAPSVSNHQAISGAVGGLIAYGLVHIESGNLVGWQYLYLVSLLHSTGRVGC